MTEDMIVSRIIPLTWGGEQKMLPVLPMKSADEWRQTFVKAFPDNADGEDIDAAVALAQAGDKIVEVLMAYDQSKVLGTREWIEANVTDDELIDAFLEVYRRSFRLGRLPLEMLQTQRAPQPAR